jgi:hypothetical protein
MRALSIHQPYAELILRAPAVSRPAVSRINRTRVSVAADAFHCGRTSDSPWLGGENRAGGELGFVSLQQLGEILRGRGRFPWRGACERLQQPYAELMLRAPAVSRINRTRVSVAADAFRCGRTRTRHGSAVRIAPAVSSVS